MKKSDKPVTGLVNCVSCNLPMIEVRSEPDKENTGLSKIDYACPKCKTETVRWLKR